MRDTGIITDYTNGTGTLGAGGQITIPDSPNRSWLFIQNQSAVTIPVTYSAVKASDGTATTATLLLAASGAGSGTQGGAEERSFTSFIPTGAVVVGSGAGTANAQVMVVGAP